MKKSVFHSLKLPRHGVLKEAKIWQLSLFVYMMCVKENKESWRAVALLIPCPAKRVCEETGRKIVN